MGMNLIPEYDPTKYMQSNVVNQEEDDDVKRTNNHYSSSYLDTYSTLMDIPQIMANDDMSDQKQENDYDQNQDKTEEDDEEKENDDDDDEDEDDEDDNQEDEIPHSIQDSIKLIMQRLDAMENRMDQQFQTINARLTIMEGKVKFVESQQSSQSKSSDDNGQTSTASNHASSAPPKHRSVTPLSTENDTFSKSTIGSSSLPISLTPRPMTNNQNINNRKYAMSKTMPRNTMRHMNMMPIQSNIDNRYISGANSRQPKHIHAPTARSPFIGSMSMQPFGRTNIYSSGQTMSSLYGTNPHIDIMQYPLSSSDGHNKTSPIPHIQSVALSSNDQSSSDNPDNTLNFINELKEMLKSTDRLLKNKPMRFYDSRV